MALLKNQSMAADLRSHLEEQAVNGYGWVVYDTDNPIDRQYDLLCFKDQFEAEDDAKEYQQMFNWHEAVPIGDLIYQLKELENAQLGRPLPENELNQPNSTLEINNDNMDGKVNRAKQLWENWERQEKQIESLAGISTDRNSLAYKYDFLSKGLSRLSVNPTEDEKLFMQAIKTVTAKLQKQLYPNPLVRMLHRLKVFIVDKPAHLELFNRNKSENLQMLNGQLKSAGLQHFVDNLQNKLDYESSVIELKSLSALNNNNKIEVNVNLEKGKLGSYGFNGYDVALTNENGERTKFTFTADNKITLTEAVNLLQGRPVFKSYENADGSHSQRWIQLDRQQENSSKPELLVYPPDYNFDLKKVLLDNATQLEFYTVANDSVRRGLEAGNRVELQINGNGRYSVTADPSSGKIEFFDSERKPLSINSLKKIINPVKQHKNKETSIIQQKEVQQDNQMRIIR
ncbi:hypothetical protein [Pedobacter alluvionis]|uniref:Uncharacterized protein n=1 Tax=Pedobacter alluvionis TaxID=475253 RepID=A0A497Y3A6_9SPHI|nr:hypothetical protein [Pedobacter alluvionis]RLJ77351.1 hypothetical protein BCL90_2436 [Pedobacter alluvionis]TFB33427.1 hypothetical protein E3V97_05110 [Pedobacter alluvionis]